MTYINYYGQRGVRGAPKGTVETYCLHSWEDFTEARLAWLYGPDHAKERDPKTQADLAAWRNLGRRNAA